ncbi:hypothetical protein [Gloeothece verrucosa]|uniref:Uncharacterized protein n=1 Tax=Gloeothece verrucosa (strain PCC 7822) TaxID=497965 RepID=E0UMI7_GLOV7|nr:hypothetical protein [Gloeothece verrucosa]ADN18167.1 hypothetical protein Cyan7822_6380 [Gloeothece verrucosa PCC 7822]
MLIIQQQIWNHLSQQFLANKNKALLFAASGAAGGGIGSILGEAIMADVQRNLFSSWVTLVIRVGIWFGLVGASISTTLLLGYFWYLNRQIRLKKAVLLGILPGFIAGIISGAIAQGIYSLIGPTELLRVICWGIAGGLLGLGLSFKIPNLGKWLGFFGGLIGGILGGCLFILFTYLIGEVVGRFWGLIAIGFFIGLMIILVEAAFREAWVIIHWSPTEKKTLSLGQEPIILGSDNHAEIYLSKNQGYFPITAKLYTQNKEIILQFNPEYANVKQMSKTSQVLKNGDKRQFGNLIIEVKTSP